MLKSTHGTVILKKDTILYHATDEEFSYRPDSQLRTVFHPSEWTGYDNERSEVFSYSCNINTPNWINYPIELMKRSKKYLKPLGLKLGFNVMDWS
jgi:hypothetical protein